MGTNFHTALIDGVSRWKATDVNPPWSDLDKAITYLKNIMVGCDGVITYNSTTGVLTWTNTIRIYFISAAGLTIRNTIAAGNITLTDGQFVYCDLSETDSAAITVYTATISGGSASNFKTYNRLILGYRNATDDRFYAVALRSCISPLETQDGREQAITCADSVTIDWNLGATARMTFDRDSVSIALSNPSNGKVYRLLLIQSGGGSDTISWSTTIKWRGGSAPTLSTDSGAIDILTFVYINGVWYGDCSNAFS